MPISPWETDRAEPPMSVTVYASYLRELQADAARWRKVRDDLAYVYESMVGGTHAWGFKFPRPRCATITEVIDRLIEEETK